MLTDVSLEEIDQMETWQGSELNKAKELLAYELTKLVHNQEEADKAQQTARGLFSGTVDTANMPSTQLSHEQLVEGKIGILDLLVACKLAPSKREARQLIQQGGILLDGEKVTDQLLAVTSEQLTDGVVIKKGKKIYHRVTLDA